MAQRRLQLATSESDAAILERAARWTADVDWSALNVARLREVAEIESTDFAAALFYDRLVRSREHGPFIRVINERPASASQASTLTIAVVPGAFYIESPHTGANGRVVLEEAQRWGCRTELIPLRSFDTVAVNCAILCDWLKRYRGKPIVLVSLSKGGAEVKAALARPDAAELFRNVTAWIDLSGLTNGTPLVGWLMRRPLRCLAVRVLFCFKGYSFAALHDINRPADGPSGFAALIPAHLRTIHVIGVPRVHHLTTKLSRRGHRRLSPLGPSDSAILLGDALRLPGLVYPIWGADHYLRPAGQDMSALIARFLGYLTDELG